MTLTVRLVLLALFATLPAIAVEAFGQLEQRRARTAEVYAQAERLTEQAAAEMQHIVTGIERVSATLAQTRAARLRDSAACTDLLVKLRRVQPGHVEFGIADVDGNVFCNGRAPGAVVRAKGAHVRQAVETDRFVVGTYAPGPVSGANYLTFGYPVRDEAGRPTGVVLAALDLDWLAAHMQSRFLVPEGAFALADRAFTYLVRLPDPENLVGTTAPERSRAVAARAGKGAFEIAAEDGTRHIVSALPLSFGGDGAAPDLWIAATLSRAAAFRAIDAATWRGVGLIATGMLLALLAALVAGHRFIRRPVAALLGVAERWRAGDYAARAHLTDHASEIGRLGQAFDRMAAELERRERAHDEAEARLTASLAEKETLLKEIHHRVRNNLQIVGSLLSLELGRVADPAAQERLRTVRRRIDVLGQVHAQLYRAESLARIDFGQHLRELARSLNALHGDAAVSIAVAAEPLGCDLDTAIPLGLIANELVTNSLKHAFPDGRAGRVEITFRRAASGDAVELTVADDGVGGAATPSRGGGLGTSLVQSLARQVGAEVTASSAQGTRVTLRLDPARFSHDDRASTPVPDGARTEAATPQP